jgi:replication fork clamp-binding protein CrfC
MRVFVKDERKFEAAQYAFQQLCKKFADMHVHEADAAVLTSPVKDRVYASQTKFSRNVVLSQQMSASQSGYKRESQIPVEEIEQQFRMNSVPVNPESAQRIDVLCSQEDSSTAANNAVNRRLRMD